MRPTGGTSRLLLAAAAGALVVVVAVVAWLLLNAGGTAASISARKPGLRDRPRRRKLGFPDGSDHGGQPARPYHQRPDRPVQRLPARSDPSASARNWRPRASCDESIVFVPTREGGANAALLVSVEGLDAPLEVKLSAEATPPTPSPIPIPSHAADLAIAGAAGHTIADTVLGASEPRHRGLRARTNRATSRTAGMCR